MPSATVSAARPQYADRIPLGTLLAYGAPALPLAILTLPVYIYLPPFYAEQLGIPIGIVGTVLLVTRVIDAVSDPLAGYLSDRWRTRYGRRKPWMIAATPLVMLAAYQLFLPPAASGAGHLLLWSAVLSLAWTAALIPYSAWGAELTPGYEERSRVTGVREAITVLGILLATALPAAIPAFGWGGQATALAAVGLLIVVLLPLAVATAVVGTPEPPERSRQRIALRQGLAAMAANAPFRRLLGAFFINSLGNAVPATVFIFFVTHRLGAPDLHGPMLFVYFLCGIVAMPAWLAIAHYTDKKTAWITALLSACVFFSWVPWLGEGDAGVFWIAVVLSGFCLGADLAIPPSMQADVVDLDTLESGEQRTATYFALWSLSTKIALALAVGLSYPLLSLAGFDPSAGRTETGLTTLALLYAGTPIALKLTAVALLWRYPLDRSRHGEIRSALDARHAAP